MEDSEGNIAILRKLSREGKQADSVGLINDAAHPSKGSSDYAVREEADDDHTAGSSGGGGLQSWRAFVV